MQENHSRGYDAERMRNKRKNQKKGKPPDRLQIDSEEARRIGIETTPVGITETKQK